MENHLFLYCAFKNLNFVSYFHCFYCRNTLTVHKYWPTVTKSVYSVSFVGLNMFSLFLFGRKQTRLELNQTLAKKKLN